MESSPTATPRPTAKPKPTLEHHASAAGSAPTRSESRCRDYVAIRSSRATIDPESDRVTVFGEVAVTGAAVRDLRVCIGGSCALVADGKRMADGETSSFSVTARGRPDKFTVKCIAEK